MNETTVAVPDYQATKVVFSHETFSKKEIALCCRGKIVFSRETVDFLQVNC